MILASCSYAASMAGMSNNHKNTPEIDIDNLCQLARIAMPEAEKQSLQKDIEQILEYVTLVQSVDVAADSEAPEIPDHRNVLREDADPYETGTFKDKLLAEAPDTDGDYIRVKKIL